MVGDSAENDANREAHELAIRLGAGGNLRGELARWCEHQHAHLAGLQIGAVGGKPVQRGQHERRCLAGARLGDAEEVAAGEDRWDSLALDRRRRRIIAVRKRIEDGLRQPERSKRQNGIP